MAQSGRHQEGDYGTGDETTESKAGDELSTRPDTSLYHDQLGPLQPQGFFATVLGAFGIRMKTRTVGAQRGLVRESTELLKDLREHVIAKADLLTVGKDIEAKDLQKDAAIAKAQLDLHEAEHKLEQQPIAHQRSDEIADLTHKKSVLDLKDKIAKPKAERERIQKCNAVINKYLRQLRMNEAEILECYDDYLKNPKLELYHADFVARSNIVEALRNQVDKGVQPEELEQDIRVMLELGEKKKKFTSAQERKGYDRMERAAAADMGAKKQMFDQKEEWLQYQKQKNEEIDEKERHGEITKEQADKERRWLHEMVEREIFKLSM